MDNLLFFIVKLFNFFEHQKHYSSKQNLLSCDMYYISKVNVSIYMYVTLSCDLNVLKEML